MHRNNDKPPIPLFFINGLDSYKKKGERYLRQNTTSLLPFQRTNQFNIHTNNQIKMKMNVDLPQYYQWKKLKINFHLNKETMKLQDNVAKKLTEMQLNLNQYIQNKSTAEKSFNLSSFNLQHFYNTQFWLQENINFAMEAERIVKFIQNALNDEATQHDSEIAKRILP